MENEKLVSILIPAYNHEHYIKETILSIINQTYKNIELIIVDDGSVDNTWNAIQSLRDECERRFSNIHFETQENKGTYITLNKLISKAAGEYVLIIASDDIAKPDLIKTECEFLDNNPEYSLVVADNEIIDKDSKVVYWTKKRNIVQQKNKASFKSYADFLQKSNKIDLKSHDFGNYYSLYWGNHVPNGYLIRKNIFDKTGYFTPEAPMDDHYLMLQIAKYSKMGFIDKILYSYRWHDSNTIKEAQKMHLIEKLTFNYEYNKVKNECANSLINEDILELWENGEFRTFFKIPFVFEIIKFKHINENKRGRIAKLFGITIYKKTKPIF